MPRQFFRGLLSEALLPGRTMADITHKYPLAKEIFVAAKPVVADQARS
ncbi:hypothetical protein [Mucilaginibacter sp. L3T2-6]|nr:hypothetical protein [Mucilaginibacter sp. L3T2-6]MDO3643607.1 hypothetical protein [Mucilaginibacter sp. L3T2-6]MDV6216145.1 hypothetical protein [Mucilaginibacter sp. L3T2-6]